MEALNENIRYENPFVGVKIVELERDHDELIQWHYHKEIEFLVLLDGELDVYIKEDTCPMKQGDVLLIGSYELHRDRTWKHSGLRYIVFQFDIEQFTDRSTLPYYRLFSDPNFALSRLSYIFQENARVRNEVSAAIMEIYEENGNKSEGYEIAVSILIKKIVLALIRNDTRGLLQHSDSAELIRMKPVLDYIEENLTGKIQVETASKVANISYFYFVKYFKKVLGMSFLDYVNHQKIKRAERYLLTKDMSVSMIGESVGMPNMAHFYKMFRKYNGCSPNEYRKKLLHGIH